MRHIGLLGIADAPLQKIKKASNQASFYAIYQDISIFLMKLRPAKVTHQPGLNMKNTDTVAFLW